jgi:hypothetical protein
MQRPIPHIPIQIPSPRLPDGVPGQPPAHVGIVNAVAGEQLAGGQSEVSREREVVRPSTARARVWLTDHRLHAYGPFCSQSRQYNVMALTRMDS